MATTPIPLLTCRASCDRTWRASGPGARVARLSAFPAALPAHARLGNTLVVGALRAVLRQVLLHLPSFKAIPVGCLCQLDMREMTYGWTVEMLVKSVRAGLRIAHVPVAYPPRLAGRSKVSGTLQGTLGTASKLSSCAVRDAAWKPHGRGLPVAW